MLIFPAPTTSPSFSIKVNTWLTENKKDVGETSIAYPSRQAFALPMHIDKQLSQPTPLGIIYDVCC